MAWTREAADARDLALGHSPASLQAIHNHAEKFGRRYAAQGPISYMMTYCFHQTLIAMMAHCRAHPHRPKTTDLTSLREHGFPVNWPTRYGILTLRKAVMSAIKFENWRCSPRMRQKAQLLWAHIPMNRCRHSIYLNLSLCSLPMSHLNANLRLLHPALYQSSMFVARVTPSTAR